MRTISLDFETCSTVDLRKAGAWRYAEDASTQILCAAYAVDEGPIRAWTPGVNTIPAAFALLERGEAVLSAWNAEFELAVWMRIATLRHGWPAIEPTQIRDTMIQSAYWGFPLGLDEATKAISGGQRGKDLEGHRLMLRMSKPRGFNEDGTPRWWHEEDPDRYARLIEYCRKDVEEERANRLLLPRLPRAEQNAWVASTRMNRRGVKIDVELADLLNAVARHYADTALDPHMELLTGGAVKRCSNAQGLLEWVRANGLPDATSLAKDELIRHIAAVQTRIARGETGLDVLLAALRLRQIAAKSSTRKLEAMLRCVSPWDGRARGVFQFYGAQRTGRLAGRLYQPQNLPRGELPKDVDPTLLADSVLAKAAELRRLRIGGREFLDAMVDFIQTASKTGGALDAIAALIRSCQISDAGPELGRLVVGDYSQIEARVVAWLAGQNDILYVFASGEDVYVYTAKKMGSDNRQLGKVCVLGLGFQMGADRFRDTAASAPYFLNFTAVEAEKIVAGWRAANPKIKAAWYNADRAFRSAMSGRTTKALRCVFAPYRDAATLPETVDVSITLPSGRRLIYRQCQVRPGTKWDGHTQLSYYGVDQKTRRWARIDTYGGSLVENITQAVARDVMTHALLRLERQCAKGSGFRPVLTVHDELGCEYTARHANDKEALHYMAEALTEDLPAWTKGLPVAAECAVLTRYRK